MWTKPKAWVIPDVLKEGLPVTGSKTSSKVVSKAKLPITLKLWAFDTAVLNWRDYQEDP